MPGYYDIYMLARERSTEVASNFLDKFAPDREQSAVDYHFPQFSEQPELVLTAARDAIRHCVAHPAEAQSFYFRNRGDGPGHVMLFFTPDAGLILGLSVEEGQAHASSSRLRDHARSGIGYVTFEEPPPDTAAEFRRIAGARSTAFGLPDPGPSG